jgi:molecular chaperone GrpE
VSPGDAARQEGPTAGDAGAIDPAVVEVFEAELAEARRLADENWDRYLRAEADLENVRRRNARLREEALARQRREVLSRFLDVADNLERALAFADSDPGALAEGVDGTYRELSKALAREGVEPIAALDTPFDPQLHEAVGVVPLPDATEDRVVSVDRTGYTLGGELLRPARVIVGQPARPAASNHEAEHADTD